MSIYLGNTEIGQIYLGDTEIATAYLGSTKVYEAGSPTPPSPTYDAEIEWLYTDGNQYIDIGSTGSEETDAFEIVFRPTSTTNQMRFLNTASNSNPIAVNLYRNGQGGFGYRYGGSWLNHGTSPGIIGTALHTWKCDFKNLADIIDGTSYAITSASTKYTSNGNVLFGGQYGSEPVFQGELYGLKKWTNDVLVLDLKPVRVSQVGYMYDNISGQLFGNAGSGDFVLGSDKTSQKAPLTFTQSQLSIGQRNVGNSLQLSSNATIRACVNREFARVELEGLAKITLPSGYWCAINGEDTLHNTTAEGTYYNTGWLQLAENATTLPASQWKFFSFNFRRSDNGTMSSTDLANIAAGFSIVFSNT